jgi:calcium-dependent protein kinase
MGCFPANKKAVEAKFLLNQKEAPLPVKSDRVDDLKYLKLDQGFLVQQSDGDPYDYYEESILLGEGSFGKVFKVFHKVSRVPRAMKIIIKSKAAMNEDDEKALINEINILKSLDHPNILKVYEYFNTKRKFYIISELCTGGELFDKIQTDKYFNEKASAHVMKQLLSAVAFCHNNNIIHRDLKPENILIESEEEYKKEYFTIKIIDFGTSEIVKNAMLDKRIGTPFYIAPEVLNNHYNEKCDLWSCGVILYILICGYPPFNGDSEDEIYSMVRKGKYTTEGRIWDDASFEVIDLIKHLLCKDITRRFSAEQALNHIWFRKMKDIIKLKPIATENLKAISNNIKNFRANQKMQQATLAFIVHNLTKKEEVEELRNAFHDFDENGDGRLTKEELIKGLSKVMTPSEAKLEVDRIMELVDTDNNGFIEYEEFIRASMNKEKLLSENNLQSAFDMFDKDKNGMITIKELRNVLGRDGNISENVWKQIILEIDSNGDGEVSYKEFKDMMLKILEYN